MADAYERGVGVPKSSFTAADYMVRALEGGHTKAVEEMTNNSNAWSQGFRSSFQVHLHEKANYRGSTDGDFTKKTLEAIKRLAKKG